MRIRIWVGLTVLVFALAGSVPSLRADDKPSVPPDHASRMQQGLATGGRELAAHVQADGYEIGRLSTFLGRPISWLRAMTRLHATAMAWFARAGVVPARLSVCNNLSVTRLAILHGVATGLVPIRVMRDELDRGEAKLLPVTPPIPGHRVSLCYQASEFGPKSLIAPRRPRLD